MIRVDRDAMLNVFNYMELVVDLRGVKFVCWQ